MASYRSAQQKEMTVLPKSGQGSAAEAIDLIFDRTSSSLPVFVSRTPSLLMSFALALCVFLMGLKAIMDDKKNNKGSNAIKQFRWVVMLGILLFVCAQLQDFVADKVYMASNIKKNAQHYANVWWLEKYCDAVRSH